MVAVSQVFIHRGRSKRGNHVAQISICCIAGLPACGPCQRLVGLRAVWPCRLEIGDTSGASCPYHHSGQKISRRDRSGRPPCSADFLQSAGRLAESDL